MTENVEGDLLHHQPVSRTPSVGSNTNVDPEPERGQQDSQQDSQQESAPETQPEANQDTRGTEGTQETQETQEIQETEDIEETGETQETKSESPSLTAVEFRIQQLHNRLLILQNAQDVRRKSADSSTGSTAHRAREDSVDSHELVEVLQKLEELQAEKKELERGGKGAAKRGPNARSTAYKPGTPHGGIYMLPHPNPNQDGVKPAHTEDQIVPVERLGRTPNITRCPFCGLIICTEIQCTRSEAMWLMCCLMSSIGCVAGCCLIPFYIDSMRKVHHRCPSCQGTVHVCRPF